MAKNNGRVRFALVGAVRAVGPYHAAALAALGEEIELVALVDPALAEGDESPQSRENLRLRAELLAKLPESVRRTVRLFTSQQQMYDAGVEVDVEVIAVPTRFHSACAIAAMQAGHDVMVEKPLGNDVADAQEIVDAAGRLGRRLHPIFQRRLMLPQVAEIIRSGQIGPLRAVTLTWVRADAPPQFAGHQHRGVFGDLASHHLSLVSALAGAPAPTAVSGRALRSPLHAGEYLAFARVDYGDDLAANLMVGWNLHSVPPHALPQHRDEAILQVWAEGGSIRSVLPTSEDVLNEHHVPILTRWSGSFAEATKIDLDLPRTVTECRLMEHSEMARWVRGGAAPSMPIDAIAVQRIVDGFYASSDRGGELIRLA